MFFCCLFCLIVKLKKKMSFVLFVFFCVQQKAKDIITILTFYQLFPPYSHKQTQFLSLFHSLFLSVLILILFYKQTLVQRVHDKNVSVFVRGMSITQRKIVCNYSFKQCSNKYCLQTIVFLMPFITSGII